MSEKQFAYAAAELARISCECEKCKTLIVFDVTVDTAAPPDHCPSCRAVLPGFTEAVIHYRKFLDAAKKMKIQLRTAPVTE